MRSVITAILTGFVMIVFVAETPVAIAEDLSPKDIVEKSEKRYQGDDMVSEFEVTLTNEQGETRRRELIRYRKLENGLWKDLLKFLYPLDIKDTGTLNEEILNGDDIQYLYLPAAKKLRRISGKSQSWIGTDFNYEDIQTFEIENWNYTMLGSDEIDGYPVYVVEAKVKQDDKSLYSKRIFWIRKDSFYPTKYELYDKEGQLWKTVTMSEVSDCGGGALYAKHMRINNAKDNHKTEFERRWVVLNTNMPEEIVATRQLEKSIEFYQHPANLKDLRQSHR